MIARDMNPASSHLAAQPTSWASVPMKDKYSNASEGRASHFASFSRLLSPAFDVLGKQPRPQVRKKALQNRGHVARAIGAPQNGLLRRELAHRLRDFANGTIFEGALHHDVGILSRYSFGQPQVLS